MVSAQHNLCNMLDNHNLFSCLYFLGNCTFFGYPVTWTQLVVKPAPMRTTTPSRPLRTSPCSSTWPTCTGMKPWEGMVTIAIFFLCWLQGLSLLTDTLPKKNRREKIEVQLDEIEKFIDLIDKHPIIIISDNPYMIWNWIHFYARTPQSPQTQSSLLFRNPHRRTVKSILAFGQLFNVYKEAHLWIMDGRIE